MEIDLGAVWPDWEIAEPISKGAFGQVYRAVRKKKGDVAAVKIISLPQNMEEIAAKRRHYSDETIKASYKDQAEGVLAEIKIMKELVGSGNIVGIQDYELAEKPGGIGYDVYIRMELLQPMEEHHVDLELNQDCANYTLPEEEIIKIGSDICRALETCHTVMTESKKQIIHRDIKPANILYHKNSDSYKLGDFGVSKELEGADTNLTRSIGTCNYMAPEVFLGKQYDCRADIYSLGLVLYVLANKKRLPFVKEAGRYKDELTSHECRMAGKTLPPPEYVSDRLSDVILKACSYKAGDRFASAKAFRLALESITAEPVPQKNTRQKPAAQKAVMPVQPTQSVQPVGQFGPKKRKRKCFPILLFLLAMLALGALATKVLPAALEQMLMFAGENSATQMTQNHNQTESPDETPAEIIDTEPPQTEADVMAADGKTRETAVPLVLSKRYEIQNEVRDDWEHWYKLETSPGITNYFLHLCGSDPVYSVDIVILDEQLNEITSGWSRDLVLESGSRLQPDTIYYVRINGDRHANSYWFMIEEEVCDAGASREDALPIQLDMDYEKSISVDGEIDWFGFTTTGNESIYRVFVNTKINDNPVGGYTTFTLYDANGIKQKQHTLDYEASGYFDIYIPFESQYTIKVSVEDTVPTTGDYLLRVTEKPIDAGIDQDTARSLAVGSRHTGKLDTSLSDWYVFTFEKSGEYVLEFHNIDTGCRVELCGTSGADFYTTVKNEDSASRKFSVEAGDKLYLEVGPSGTNDAAVANGTYIISITE